MHGVAHGEVKEFLMSVQKISKETKLSFDEIMRAYEYLQKECSAYTLLDDLNTKDEQLAGFGELIRETIELLREGVEKIPEPDPD